MTPAPQLRELGVLKMRISSHVADSYTKCRGSMEFRNSRVIYSHLHVHVHGVKGTTEGFLATGRFYV